MEGWRDLSLDFPGTRVANRGRGGDTSRDVLDRLERDVLVYDPQAVVLLVGTNDIGRRQTPSATVARIAAIVGRLRATRRSLPIVVFRIPPADWPKDLLRAILELNALIDAKFASSPGVRVFDSFAILSDSTGRIDKRYFADGKHLNDDGYRRLASALRPILREL